MGVTEKTQIVIADDHAIVRHGLRQSLEVEDDIDVIAEAGNGLQAVRLAAELTPDILIMDVAMPELNGIEATRQIKNKTPGTQIIALSMHTEKQYVMSMLAAGARGYLLKSNLFEELVKAIRTVNAGHVFLSAPITGYVVASAIGSGSLDDPLVRYSLTAREREILQLLAEGKTHDFISKHLYISTKTVETHRAHIMKKLKLDNIPALTKFALKHGVTSIDFDF